MKARTRRSIVPVLWIALAAAACHPSRDEPQPPGPDLSARARELARSTLLIDTHVDIPYRLMEGHRDIGGSVEEFDFDYPRAVEGGLDLPFMSIYVPAELPESEEATDFADRLIDMMEEIAASRPKRFTMVRGVEQARSILFDGRVGFALGMENGGPIDDLVKLRHFHDRGIRYVTLTHSKDNHICDSSYDTARTWKGLSPFGRELVVEMNRVGMMIDVSHVSDDAFHQVLELSQAPVIASHSSCRHFTPEWERNLSDDMIRALADGGGVIQINFGSAFLLDSARRQSSDYWAERARYLESEGLEHDAPEAESFAERYWAEHERIYADVTDVADHIDHVVGLVGVDHVGFGSDFDGVGDSLPTGLKSVADYPALIAVLLERGYSESDIEKICGANLLRVWEEVERIAAALGNPAG